MREEITSEIRALMLQIQEVKGQIRTLKERFEALKGQLYEELENLQRKYRELLYLVAEKVAKLADLMEVSVREVVDELAERGIIFEEERDEVLRIAQLFVTRKPAKSGARVEGPRAGQAQAARETVRERVLQMAEQEARREFRSMLRSEPVRRALQQAIPPPSAPANLRPATFTCPLCNEDHEIANRVTLDVCDMCHDFINELVSQGFFKFHGAAVKRKIREFLLTVESQARGRRNG